MENIQLAPIQLEGYFVRELLFAARGDATEEVGFSMQPGLNLQRDVLFNPDALTVDVQTAVAPHQTDPLRWACILEVKSNLAPEIRFPYDFKIVLVGYFSTHPQLPEQARAVMVKVNAASLLYSAARELLLSATMRGAFPGVVLPTVVFGLGSEPEPQQLPAPEVVAPEVEKKTAKKATKKGATKKTGGKKQQR